LSVFIFDGLYGKVSSYFKAQKKGNLAFCQVQ